jgi:hypothetical protein
VSERPTPETDALASEHRGAVIWPDFARKLERERDEAREECSQYRGMLIRLYNDLFVHHGGQAVREFKELFREENYN